MKVLITGGAGFIGSHLCQHLLSQGHSVTAYDNLLLGRRQFLDGCEKNPRFQFIEKDLVTDTGLRSVVKGHDLIYHLAANSDISLGSERTDLDLNNGLISTYNILEAMRLEGIKKIVFSSSSAVYGEATKKPTAEDYGPLVPLSLYGASKLSSESFVMSFAHNYGFQSWIFRFANIVGARVTHGVIFDFITRLKKNPKELKVLGNGKQRKSYLHLQDCIEAMEFAVHNSNQEVNIFNLASQGTTEVKYIAEQVVKSMNLKSVIEYGSSDRGWKGDVPFTWLDGSSLEKLGWKARLESNQAIDLAIQDILNDWYD